MDTHSTQRQAILKVAITKCSTFARVWHKEHHYDHGSLFAVSDVRSRPRLIAVLMGS
jgi:hypothetical protein